MISWKRALLGILPVTVYLYAPVREVILNHYATRWSAAQSTADRTVSIRVENQSADASLPIRIQIHHSGARIVNFEYADPWNGPRLSSLGVAQHSEALRRFTASLKHPMVVDEHAFSPSLEDLEIQLESTEVMQDVPKKHRPIEPLKEMTFENHLLWLTQCHSQSPASHPCCMERAWEDWEYLLRGMQLEQDTFWKQSAGMQVQYADFHFAQQGDVAYVLTLPGKHSILLEVQFGADPLSAEIGVTTNGHDALKVRSTDDLDRSVVSMLWLYPDINPWIAAMVILSSLATAPLWMPLKFLRTSTVVNRALAKVDEMEATDEWKEVGERLTFLLRDKFDYFRSARGKTTLRLGDDDLFAFLRARFRLAYRAGRGRFRNNEHLFKEIKDSMDWLAKVS